VKRTLAIAGVLLAAQSAAQTQDIKVRIYSLQPPTNLTIASARGTASWAACPACRATVLTNLQVEADDGRLRFAGIPQSHATLLIRGSYRLSGSQHAPFAASLPLEIRARGNQLVLTLSLPLEEYVAAVLAAESRNQQSDQSLQAMAVAARTFAVHFRGRHKTEHFDFCDTTHCQDFRFSAINDRIRAAVEATEGELLWYEGRPAATYYHQNCGGNTAASADVWPGPKLSYLRGRQDPYCLRSNGSTWRSSIAKSDLQKALHNAGLKTPEAWTALEIEVRTPTGRARKLRLAGATGANERISASSFRFAVNRALGWNQIRSDLYEVRDAGDQIVFTGRGSGHGVGLCQSGAAEMGKQGSSYREILAFYYPGTALGVTAQGLSWQSQSGEQLEMLTTHVNEDSPLIAMGERIMREAEETTGLRFGVRPRLKVYPTLDTYRDSTREPGWVAASTRGRTIRLQPPGLLRSHSALKSTLRHEFLHLLIEAHARPGLPLWFREGLVLYLANPSACGSADPPPDKQLERLFQRAADRQQMDRAYAAARARVAELVEKNGTQVVLGWITSREKAPF
jgi:stage II sporulation protein D